MVVQVKNYSPMAAFDVYEATVPLDLNLGWPIFVPSVEALNDRLDCDLASLDEGDGVARRVGDEEETLPPIPCSEFASGIAGRNGPLPLRVRPDLLWKDEDWSGRGWSVRHVGQSRTRVCSS
jgi:hypothetical protein